MVGVPECHSTCEIPNIFPHSLEQVDISYGFMSGLLDLLRKKYCSKFRLYSFKDFFQDDRGRISNTTLANNNTLHSLLQNIKMINNTSNIPVQYVPFPHLKFKYVYIDHAGYSRLRFKQQPIIVIDPPSAL